MKMRIALSAFLLSLVASCAGDDPISFNRAAIGPSPCGLWKGTSHANAEAVHDARPLQPDIRQDPWPGSLMSCSSLIRFSETAECVGIVNGLKEYICVVRQIDQSASGIGTSPSFPEESGIGTSPSEPGL